MKVLQARLNLSEIKSIPDKSISSFTTGIVAAMTGNRHFPSPSPKLEDIQRALDNFTESNLPPNKRSGDSSDVKKANKKVLIDLLISLGKDVERVAGDNIDALRSSGFTVVEVEKVTQAPDAPSTPTIFVNGVPNMLLVQLPRVETVDLYELTVKSAVGEKFYFSNTTRTIEATNLPVGETLEIQMRMRNTVGFGPYGSVYETRIPRSGELLPVRK